MHSTEKVEEPFYTIHIDHLGPFVRSNTGNTYVILAVHCFTKFVLLRAVRYTSAGPAEQFIQDLVGTFEPPTMGITDGATAFTSDKFNGMFEHFKLTHVKNARAKPKANGQVEEHNGR